MTSTKRNIINGILVLTIIGLIIVNRIYNLMSLNLVMIYVYGIITIQQLVWAYYYNKNNEKKKAIQNILIAIVCIVFNIYVYIKYLHSL